VASSKFLHQVIGISLSLLVPTVATLLTIREPRALVPVDQDPSPYGYTVSLLFWILPVLVMGAWFHDHHRSLPERKAFWVTVAALSGVAFVLDVVLATRFFVFRYPGATLGLDVPVVGGSVPIEEFLFYFFGFLVILLAYVWFKVAWFGNEHVLPIERHGVVRFHALSLLGATGIFTAKTAWKVLGPHDQHEGFPGYLLFLDVVAFLPPMALWRSVQAQIHWKAFGLVLFLVTGVAMLWEASLAIPYQWWGYDPRWMCGLPIRGWSDLPVEAALLWIAVTWATVIVYEVLRTVTHHGGTTREALFGRKI